MRIIAKRDRNHAEIVKRFRDLGCSVLDLGSVGGGCPDILVGYGGINALVEIKDGSKPPSARTLTSDQVDFFASWRGDVIVVATLDDVKRLYEVMGCKSGVLKKHLVVVKAKTAAERREIANRAGEGQIHDT